MILTVISLEKDVRYKHRTSLQQTSIDRRFFFSASISPLFLLPACLPLGIKGATYLPLHGSNAHGIPVEKSHPEKQHVTCGLWFCSYPTYIMYIIIYIVIYVYNYIYILFCMKHIWRKIMYTKKKSDGTPDKHVYIYIFTYTSPPQKKWQWHLEIQRNGSLGQPENSVGFVSNLPRVTCGTHNGKLAELYC